LSLFQSVENDLKKEGKSAEKLAAKREKAFTKVQDIKEKLEGLSFSASEFDALEQQRNELETSVSELSDLVDTLSAQLQGRLAFNYSDPVRGFDRSKVKGLVAKLIKVKDSKHATALEVVAGGKLYQVVVDEAITGKALLDRGKLQRRVTIIPLDKIKPRQVGASACNQASSIAGSLQSTAQSAIELVGFEEEVRSAVEYVFGSTIIVDGMKAANQICDATKTRTVTLEGDVYDPSGTISGGSKNQLGTTLAKLTQLTEATKELDEKQATLKAAIVKLDSMKSESASYDKLSTGLELAEAELEYVDKHLSQTSFGMLAEKRDSMTKELQDMEEELVNMEKEKGEKWTLYEELKEKEIELTQQREHRLAAIEEAVKKAKIDVASKTKNAREVRICFVMVAYIDISICITHLAHSIISTGPVSVANPVFGTREPAGRGSCCRGSCTCSQSGSRRSHGRRGRDPDEGWTGAVTLRRC
jgi:structural maintenance of chromosome 2